MSRDLRARVEVEDNPLPRVSLYLGDVLLRTEFRYQLTPPTLFDDLAAAVNARIDARISELLAANKALLERARAAEATAAEQAIAIAEATVRLEKLVDRRDKARARRTNGNLLPMSLPKYWTRDEAIRKNAGPAIEAYLYDRTLSPEHIAALRDYLRMWIEAPVWAGDLADLRARVNHLADRDDIARWLNDADDLGIDPL